jgi:hypothetical protein
MFLTFGVMMVWPKKKSDGKEMKKAYCGFSVAIRRPWKSREKKLNAWHQNQSCTKEVPPSYVDAATQSSSGELPDPIDYFNQFRAGGSCAPSSTSDEKCHDGSSNVCEE